MEMSTFATEHKQVSSSYRVTAVDNTLIYKSIDQFDRMHYPHLKHDIKVELTLRLDGGLMDCGVRKPTQITEHYARQHCARP